MFPTLSSELLSKETLLCFPTQRPFLCCSESELRTNNLAADHVKQNSVWARLVSNWKDFSSRKRHSKAFKNIQSPTALCGNAKKRNSKEKIYYWTNTDKGQALNFLTTLKLKASFSDVVFYYAQSLNRVFRSTSRNYCSCCLKRLPAWWKCLQWHKHPVGSIFWRLLTLDIAVLFISYC